MLRALVSCMALVLLWPTALPAAAKDAAVATTAAGQADGCVRALSRPRSVRSQDEKLLALLDALARQIAEINGNLANLGPNKAAAMRYRSVSLAAYQHAWAKLTRHEIEFGGGFSQERAAAAGAPR